jgi:hypothetical protein
MKLKLAAAIAGVLCLSACASTLDRFSTGDTYVAPRASLSAPDPSPGAGAAGGGGAGAGSGTIRR